MLMDLSVYGRRPPRRTGEAESNDKAGEASVARETALTERAQALAAALPQPVRLNHSLRYPHVVNRLAELWGSPARMRFYLQDLLLDNRGTRHGFPLPVIAELTAIRNYYETRVHPIHPDVWSNVRRRS
jgi:hypothetical protein